MATNFPEQLAAEWYEEQGYFIRTNVRVGILSHGGYECELDIVAFNPEKNHLLHIEACQSATTWKEREGQFNKKFEAGRKYIPTLFKGLAIPSEIEQIALILSASDRTEIDEGRIVTLPELLKLICDDLKNRSNSRVIPEQYSLLRLLQYLFWYQDRILGT